LASDTGAPTGPETSHRVLFAGVFWVAFATLLAEVAIIRVLSYTIWHHFGYILISTALLGYGASGTLIALRPDIGSADLRRTLTTCSLLSAISVAGLLGFIAAVPLHPMKIVEDPGQFAIFLGYLVFTAVPFFFSGLAITLALRQAADRVDRLYFWDLVGAGLGGGSAVALMNWLSPPGAALAAAAGFAGAAAVFAAREARRVVSLVLAGVFVTASFFASEITFTPAQSKHLAMLMALVGIESRHTSWTALFRTDLVEEVDVRIGCREMGMSAKMEADTCVRPRYWFAHDGSAGAPVYDTSARPRYALFDYHILRVPYLVATPEPRVLVIGVGGGRDVLVARQFGASHVTGVELDPIAIDLLNDELEATRDFFRDPAVELVAGEGRHYVRATDRLFDMIQLTGVDTLAAEYSGSYVLAENYLYTVEAFLDYFARLAPGGMLSIATGNLSADQPRAAGRAVSVAQEALRRMGIENPERHIAVIDSKRLYVGIMVRREPFSEAQVAALEEWAKEYEFRPLHLPGRVGHPVFDGLASAVGGERERLLGGLRHLVHATVDDRPFFFTFYRWTGLFEPGHITPSHVTALGQIVLAILIIALTLLGALFILLPLFVFRRRGIFEARSLGVLAFFLSLGFGFMLFEISLIQRFVLFLGYPTYSLTVTLSSLLVFLGCGSYLSKRWVGRERVALPLAVVAIGLLTLFYTSGLPIIQDALLGTHIALRVVTTVLVLMPLGLVLGMFFPLGIRAAAEIHPDLVPWAWAINGCASVSGGMLTIALAMTFGFAPVWILSLLVYAGGVGALLLSMSTARA
jgi:hypothetical protein